ncbi:MAG TPA: tRNA lysidine(34) synthetase TilS, partial [Candidatus Methylomirabilis sp.]
RVRQTLAAYGMLAAGDGVVVAVSGGVDSMVLLTLLAALRAPLALRLHAAHLDHGLRGPEGAQDAEAVTAWASRLDVTLTCERAGPLERRGGSVQRAARAARYAFLERVADRCGARRIAVGHTRDDVAETVLLNLLRGAGLRGLAGIPPVRGPVIRPLMDVSREAIVAYARAHGVPWVEDPSNRTPTYRRNRLRMDLLPALAEGYNPRIVEVLARTAAIVRAEDEALDAFARGVLGRLARPRPWGEAGLAGRELALLAPALRRRVLRVAAESLPGRPGLAARHLTALEAWAAAGTRRGRCGFLPGIACWWEGEDLVLAPGASPPPPEDVPLPIGVPTHAKPFGMTFVVERAEVGAEGPPPPVPGEAWIAAAAAADPLVVRAWRFGDRFRPLGLRGTKKLQDFFVDAKVPRPARGRIPLVVSGERILWVVGHRIDEAARITAATRRVLRLRAHPAPRPG